jgi:phosphotransferase system enzyme I (PtsI)
LAEYGFKQRQGELERGRLSRLRNTPAVTMDGEKIELLANIEQPDDAAAALNAGAVGVGLFRSEFLFMGRDAKGSKGESKLPNEEEQFQAYKRAVDGMQGLPVTIRTVDIGADKPLDRQERLEKAQDTHLNPALGLRAIRWSLADPAMFLTQLRAILRASSFGQIKLMIPMLCAVGEIHQTLALINQAKAELDAQSIPYGNIKIGAMIEIPAAALILPTFLKYFDFLSIGTNDLIQYTLAIDRADEAVAHMYDPLHPAVLHLIANTIQQCRAQGKDVSVCGEMAGDVSLTRLLLGMGLRCFSMHPAQILTVKQQILRTDTSKLKDWVLQVLASETPAELV